MYRRIEVPKAGVASYRRKPPDAARPEAADSPKIVSRGIGHHRKLGPLVWVFSRHERRTGFGPHGTGQRVLDRSCLDAPAPDPEEKLRASGEQPSAFGLEKAASRKAILREQALPEAERIGRKSHRGRRPRLTT